MSLRTLLLPALFLFVTPGFASQEPAGGQSILKLQESPSVRETRFALAAVEQEIAALDSQIRSARSQALSSRVLPGSGGSSQTAVFEAQASAYEMQKSELLAQRALLQSDLNPQ